MELCSMLYDSLDGRGFGENGYMYCHGWVPSLFTWNYHNIISSYNIHRYIHRYTPKQNQEFNLKKIIKILAPQSMKEHISFVLSHQVLSYRPPEETTCVCSCTYTCPHIYTCLFVCVSVRLAHISVIQCNSTLLLHLLFLQLKLKNSLLENILLALGFIQLTLLNFFKYNLKIKLHYVSFLCVSWLFSTW